MNAKLTKKHGTSERLGWNRSWYSQDGTIEVRPAYEPKCHPLSTGDVRTHWLVISPEDGTQPVSHLETARDRVAAILANRK